MMNINAFHYLEKIRKYVLLFPGVEEYSCYRTPGFRVNKKLFARLKEDGQTLVVRNEARERWIKKNPAAYFITEHYQNHPYLLVNLEKVKNNELEILLIAAWKLRAGKKLLKVFKER